MEVKFVHLNCPIIVDTQNITHREDKEVEPDEKYLPKVARFLARNARHPISDNLANEVAKKTQRKLRHSQRRRWTVLVDKVSILAISKYLTCGMRWG